MAMNNACTVKKPHQDFNNNITVQIKMTEQNVLLCVKNEQIELYYGFSK